MMTSKPIKAALAVFVVAVTGSAVCAQDERPGVPAPSPTPVSTIQRDDQQDISNRSRSLRLTENLPPGGDLRNNPVYRNKIRPLYRKPKKKELREVAPDPALVAKHKKALGVKSSGMTVLIADKGCDSNPDVLVSSEHCTRYSFPGAGASYSFRTENYRIRQLGDMNFTGEVFQSVGVLTHGIFAELGNVSIDDASKSPVIAYLEGIEPASTFAEATDLISRLEKGINENGTRYSNFVPVKPDTSYALRSIAYRGESLRTVDGLVYDELSFDKRRDVIVVFRVLETEPGESATVLWRILKNSKSPKIKE